MEKAFTKDLISKLKTLQIQEWLGMARFGINSNNTYYVSMLNLRKMAREIGKDHILATGPSARSINEIRG